MRKRTRPYIDVCLKPSDVDKLKTGKTVNIWKYVGGTQYGIALKLADNKLARLIKKKEAELQNLRALLKK